MFEIYFRDLNKDAQEAYLEFMNIKDPKDGNFDVLPITILEYYPEEDE